MIQVYSNITIYSNNTSLHSDKTVKIQVCRVLIQVGIPIIQMFVVMKQ